MSFRAEVPKSPPRLRLRLSAPAEAALRAGHPWVFADGIRESNRDGLAGELAVIYDRRDRFLAVGLFDPNSPIRVRILHLGGPEPIDDAWWRARLERAVERRRGLFDERTTGYRMINGESDGWPGLVLDRYQETLVLKLYTVAWLPRLREVAALISDLLKPERMVLRLSRNVQRVSARLAGGKDPAGVLRKTPARSASNFRNPPGPEEATGLRDGEVICGLPLAGPLVFLESGLQFEADVVRGQKTGFFLDQRENRRRVESLSHGRRVLNVFSFSGGFSLYAARGGAASVTDLDISAHALAGARRNFGLNQSDPRIARCRHVCEQAEAFAWLGTAGRERYDGVILDPPSFAKRESERAAAIHAYEKLVSLGAGCVGGEGWLVACSCSAHVAADEFFAAARRGVSRARRQFAELQTTRHAPDHPASFKEAEYLKAIYLLLK